jgi:hypothetical protein
MSNLDRALRATGLAVTGSAITWMVFFGVFFLVDMARHQQAHLTVRHGSFWPAIPIMLTVVITAISIVSSVNLEP